MAKDHKEEKRIGKKTGLRTLKFRDYDGISWRFPRRYKRREMLLKLS
jgi:hypothetical protein